MSTDWDALEKQYSQQFKTYAGLGRYKVKVESAEVKAMPSGSIRVVFTFTEDDQYKYPKSAAHWMTRNNIGWTKQHHCNILQALGVDKVKARQAIDGVEKDGATTDQLVKGYQALYDRACSRHPIVEIEVREQRDQDGNIRKSDAGYAYNESEITANGVYMTNTKKASSETVESVDDLGGEDINIDEIPF